MDDSTTGTAAAADRPTADRLRGLRTRLLSLAALHADRVVNERLALASARKWHYAVLATLDQFGPASQMELSARTGIYRSDLVAVINELVDRGQAQRSTDPVDRRRNVISLAGPGRRQLRKLDALLAEAEAEVFAPLTTAQRDELANLLAVLVDHHGHPGRAPTRGAGRLAAEAGGPDD